MAASKETQIITILVDKITALEKSAGVNLFNDVIPRSEGNFTKYPVVTIDTKGGRGTRIDTHRIERTFVFEIKLWQEESQAGKTKEEAVDIMRAASEIVMESFDKDQDLSGEVETVNVVNFDYSFKVVPATFVFATYTIEVVVVLPNY